RPAEPGRREKRREECRRGMRDEHEGRERERGGETHHGGRHERAQAGLGALRDRLGADGNDDEHQAGERGRGGPHEQIELVPAFGHQTLFSRIRLSKRSVAGQSPTKIPQRSAWASSSAAFSAGSVILLRTCRPTSSRGPKNHTTHDSGTESNPTHKQASFSICMTFSWLRRNKLRSNRR